MKKMKYVISILLLVCLLGTPALAVSDSTGVALPYENYTYSEKGGKILLAPQAYLPETIVYGQNYGIGNFSEPSDIFEDDSGDIYLLDGNNNRVVVFSKDLKLLRVLTGFVENGQLGEFTGAQGLYVDGNYLYICDTNHLRIIVLDKTTGALLKNIKAPEDPVLGSSFVFKPIKLATDSDQMLYVIGDGVYEGVITMDWDSNFLGFIGTNAVRPSAWDIFWMQFYTRAQRESTTQFVPQDFSSIDMDDDGFFFCTTFTQQSDSSMVKRLNPGGDNVLRKLSNTKPVGDPGNVLRGALSGYSSFYDVSCGHHGIYACLDHTRGKIFVYDNDGYLLYTFGARSEQEGGFSADPAALTWLQGDKIAVLDRLRGCFTVFTPTDYARAIHEGVQAQIELDYDLAFQKWQHVLSLNSNYEMAHIQIGKVYMNTGRYREAMQEFRLGNNKALYSDAKGENRAEWIYNNITYILIVLAVVILFFVVRGQIKKYKRWKEKRGER